MLSIDGGGRNDLTWYRQHDLIDGEVCLSCLTSDNSHSVQQHELQSRCISLIFHHSFPMISVHPSVWVQRVVHHPDRVVEWLSSMICGPVPDNIEVSACMRISHLNVYASFSLFPRPGIKAYVGCTHKALTNDVNAVRHVWIPYNVLVVVYITAVVVVRSCCLTDNILPFIEALFSNQTLDETL